MELPHKITHIFFDLDHTLWDFEKNSQKTLLDLLEKYTIINRDEPWAEKFLKIYKNKNAELWSLYNFQHISKEELRHRRFREAFYESGIHINFDIDAFGDDYLYHCTRQPHVFQGCHEVLKKLNHQYTLGLITNGFEEATHSKLNSSLLNQYFKSHNTIITEKIGFQKPHKNVFNHALEITQGNAEQSIMIGDNLESDIRGALDADICPIWFNPEQIKQDRFENIIEIQHLETLLTFL